MRKQTYPNQPTDDVLEIILKLVSLKKQGKFEEANDGYCKLALQEKNDTHNFPYILKSWAKVLVCLGEYDKAIMYFERAADLFNKNDNSCEFSQCTRHSKIVKNRFDSCQDFIDYVKGVSGGSLSYPCNFDSMISYDADYRDSILYNGKILFRGAGKIINNRILFTEVTNNVHQILFNTNLSGENYIRYHNNYEIFRIPGKDNLSEGLEVFRREGTYFLTGRFFIGKDSKNKFELMKIDDPSNVYYMMLPYDTSNFIIGESCLNMEKNNPATKDSSNIEEMEKFDEAKYALTKANPPLWLLELMGLLKQTQSYQYIPSIYSKYKKYNNPFLDFLIGRWLYLANMNEEAKHFIMKSINSFLTYKSEFWKPIYIDLWGWFVAYLLLNNAEKLSDDIDVYEIYKLDFLHLSCLIRLIPSQAHDSYMNRAQLMCYLPGYGKKLLSEYHSSSAFTEVLAISDYYFASKVFDNVGDPKESQDSRNRAVNLHTRLGDITVASKNADQYSLSEIAELGKNRNMELYKKLLYNYINGKLINHRSEFLKVFEKLVMMQINQ